MSINPTFTEQDFDKLKKIKVKCFVSTCEKKAIQHKVCNVHLVLKRKYQLSYRKLEELCTTPCQICGETKDLHIDHDSDCCPLAYWTCGSCIRGVVCKDCNNILSLSKFSVDMLEKLVNYLKPKE
jgi:hypothetical protein